MRSTYSPPNISKCPQCSTTLCNDPQRIRSLQVARHLVAGASTTVQHWPVKSWTKVAGLWQSHMDRTASYCFVLLGIATIMYKNSQYVQRILKTLQAGVVQRSMPGSAGSMDRFSHSAFGRRPSAPKGKRPKRLSCRSKTPSPTLTQRDIDKI